MHDHDSLELSVLFLVDLIFKLFGELLNIHIPCQGITVYQHRLCSGPYYGSRAGNDGKRRHDDFVSGFYSNGHDGGVKCGGAVADGNAEFPVHA